ncbi:glycosyltransferase family 2 protein [Algoriphagus lacus]|nr:glycosyltransferase family 2 protein [Algoriphagus lacus]
MEENVNSFEAGSKQIAVLITCFNRVATTLQCLDHLFQATLPENTSIEVFLVDDGSPDLTGQKVKSKYPQVNVIQGDGNLYWSGGMYKAWEEAAKSKDFDFYLWLNDDTHIFPEAIVELLKDAAITHSKSLIVGSCLSNKDKSFTYGGYVGEVSLLPSGVPQKCDFTNGNLVLVPKHIYTKIGNLNKRYIHLYGDYDYSMRVNQAGLSCYSSSQFLATCEPNEKSYWGTDDMSTWQKLKLLHHPKGIDLKRGFYFKKYHFGTKVGIKVVLDAYLRILTPALHRLIKRKKSKVKG